MADQLYLLSLSTEGCPVNDYARVTSVSHGQCKEGDAIILHRFKVTGENTLLLVIKETSSGSVDSLIQQRLPGSLKVNCCIPLLPYEVFAKSIGVEIPEGTPLTVENGQFMWLEFNIEYPGKTMEELMKVWKQEAEVAVKTKRQKQLDVYKVVAERKVHLFIKSPPEYVDKISFGLPLMVGLGDSVNIKTKGVCRF